MIKLTKGFDTEKMDDVSVKTIELLEKNLNDGLSELIKGLNIEDNIAKVQEAINEVKSMNMNEETENRLREIELKMIEINAMGRTGSQGKSVDKTEKFCEAFKNYITTNENGEKFIDFKSALQGVKEVRLDYDKKDAGTILGGGASTRVTVDGKLPQTPVYRPWLFDVANVRKATSPNVMYLDKTAPEGTAAFVEEGGLKPLIDWQYEQKTANAKKVAVAAKFSTEVATDIDGFMADVERELTGALRSATEYAILDGDGAAGTLDGLAKSMPGYSLESIKVENPNTYDAIVAAATQIKSSSYGTFTPTHVVMNPQDVANMRLTKDNNGNYIIPLTDGDGNPFNIKIVESAMRPVGSLIMGDFGYLNVAEWVVLSIIIGHENDDIRRNLMTVVAESRMATYIKSGEKFAFLNDTIANITTAINKDA